MSFENKTTDELIRIAKAGLGFTLGTSTKSAEDLHQIADAAAQSGARITFTESPPFATQVIPQK